CVREVEVFLRRAVDEGVLRGDRPEGWAAALLPELVNLAAHGQPQLGPGQAADLVVDTFLRGDGAGPAGAGSVE
ncbi:hypothetical protein SAMN05216267_10918, partial [Actinacidiphila rubida]